MVSERSVVAIRLARTTWSSPVVIQPGRRVRTYLLDCGLLRGGVSQGPHLDLVKSLPVPAGCRDNDSTHRGCQEHEQHDPLAAQPAHGMRGPRLGISFHLSVGQPALDIVGESLRRGIALLRLGTHGLEADCLQCWRDFAVTSPGRHNVSALHAVHDLGNGRSGKRQLARQQHVERCPQAEDVAGRPDPVPVASLLFRARKPESANPGLGTQLAAQAVLIGPPRRTGGRLGVAAQALSNPNRRPGSRRIRRAEYVRA